MSSEKYLCNLVVPGAPKSGTSSLHAMLDAHPQIEMSRVKEPHHFAIDGRFAAGAASHNALFAPSNNAVWRGEASTIYCLSEKARRRIYDCLCSPKVILLLREPVARTISHFRWLTKLGHENRALGEAIRADGFGFDAERHFDGFYRAYVQFSKYATFVPLWREQFGAENVLILRSEALRANPSTQLRRCSDFLGVSEHAEVSPAALNVTASVTRHTPLPGITHASRLLPLRLRESRSYVRLRAWVRYLMTTKPRAVTEAELGHVRELLREDIDFYNDLSDD